MPKKQKSWREKLESEQEPKIIKINESMAGRFGTRFGDTMLIPRPLDVDACMKGVQEGKLVTITEIREKLARDFHVTSTCPMTTGIFAWVAAGAADEDEKAGKEDITPYWRTIKVDGSLNPKYPGGVKEQARRLKNEGHVIISSRGDKPPKVKDFEKSVQKL